ncbi:hypothetical protein Mapa_013238 [Marchantia paleacea]|nr:hypothetical protein Mapa_013238 [Marchantia paleacea]
MSADRGDRYTFSPGASSNLGSDACADPNSKFFDVKVLEMENEFGGKTVKTIWYKKSGDKNVVTGWVIDYYEREGGTRRKEFFDERGERTSERNS